MTDATAEFTGYAYAVTIEARKSLEQLPADLQAKVGDVIDDLASNPDAYPLRMQSMGQGRSGELILYKHTDFPLEVTCEIDRTNRNISFIHFAAPIFELKRVFVSYSHEDTKWLERLREFLKPLEEQGLINTWDDKKILMGADWRSEIEKSLQSASMAIFLVTQSFLTSDFIKHEELPPLLEKAKQQGVKIMWIAVGFSTVEDSVLARFQAANDPAKPLEMLAKPQRNKALLEIYKKIKAEATA